MKGMNLISKIPVNDAFKDSVKMLSNFHEVKLL